MFRGKTTLLDTLVGSQQHLDVESTLLGSLFRSSLSPKTIQNPQRQFFPGTAILASND